MSRNVFSDEWCNGFIESWNGNPALHEGLAGAGAVVFELDDETTTWHCILSWDETGAVSRLNTPIDQAMPRFRAGKAEWDEFIAGTYSAVAGVLGGKIRYTGRMSFAFRYGACFDRIAEVARRF
jgi:putative sterol carrier protein